MTLPRATLTVRDGALGIVPGSTDNLIAFVGPSSQGTVESVTRIASLQELVDTFGYGPMPEAAAQALAAGNGGAILCVRSTTTTAAAVPADGATTQSGSGPAVTLSGTPFDTLAVRVLIVTGGAVATATFKYSLDGGNTYSAEIVTASTYAIAKSGITLNFAAGTYVAAELYSGTCTPPRTTTTDLGTALDALLATTEDWALVGVFCEPADASAAAGLCTTLDTKLTAAAAAFRYARGVVSCGAVAVSGIPAGLASNVSTRVGAAAGGCTLTSPLTGRIETRCTALPIVARLLTAPVHEELARVASGPVPSVTALAVTASQAETLDTGRVMTLRSHVGLPGFYITRGQLLTSPGSDYSRLQNGRVMDKACKLVRSRAIQFLGESLRLLANGTLLPQEAARIDGYVGETLQSSLVGAGNATAAEVSASRSANIQSTSNLPITVRVLPFGYALTITVDMGFEVVAG